MINVKDETRNRLDKPLTACVSLNFFKNIKHTLERMRPMILAIVVDIPIASEISTWKIGVSKHSIKFFV